MHDLWRALSSFTLNNKANSLVQDAVYKLDHGDLIPRTFLILSILYGSYGYEPDEVSILKDLVRMLGDDLDEEELRVLEYAGTKTHTFFPELRFVWKTIREVYGTKEFDLALLPPTPYHAYSLFVLNRPEIAFSPAPLDAVFGVLTGLNHHMQKVVTLASPGAKPDLKIVK